MKILYRWLIASLVIILVVFLSVQFILTPWLEYKTEKALEESTNDQFRLTASNIQINLFRRAIKADSSSLFIMMPAGKPDTAIVNELQLQLNSIHASGISIWQLLMNNKLEISQLHLVKPHMTVTKKSGKALEKARQDPNVNFLSVSVSDLRIDSSSFTYYDSLKISQFHTEISLVQGAVEYLMPQDAPPTIDPGHTYLELNDGRAGLPGGYYDVEFLQCHISGRDSSIRIDSLMLIPLLEKYEFSQKYGYKIDRVTLNVPEINIDRWDAKELVDNGKFNAGMLSASNMYFDIFRDARLSYAPSKHTILLQRKISDLPFAFTVDSINIMDSYIRYEEKRFDDLSTGHLELDKLSIAGNRITNDTSLMKESVFKVDGEAIFMGHGELTASIQFPLDRISGHHTVSGHLGPMPIPPLNKVLYPLAKLRIESGQNDNVYFNMALNETNATGDLRFYYHDFKVNMETEKEKWINDVTSFLANNLIRDENPNNGKFIQGIINYERDTKQSIFNYWWKALRSGLITSVGVAPGVAEKE